MGCAGSNPLPGADPMTNGRAMQPTTDSDKSCSIVQRMADGVNIDDVVKKIQDVTGSMENLMGETQEKLGSLFGKAEQSTEDVENAVEGVVNDDSTSTQPEKPKVHEVIFLTVEETRVIPIGLVSEISENDPAVENNVMNEELMVEVKTEDEAQDEKIEQLNETQEKEEN